MAELSIEERIRQAFTFAEGKVLRGDDVALIGGSHQGEPSLCFVVPSPLDTARSTSLTTETSIFYGLLKKHFGSYIDVDQKDGLTLDSVISEARAVTLGQKQPEIVELYKRISWLLNLPNGRARLVVMPGSLDNTLDKQEVNRFLWSLEKVEEEKQNG